MSTMISRTQTAGTNPKKLTVSFWMKATTLGTNQGIWGCGTGAGDAVSLHFQSSDRFSLETYDGSANPKLLVNRKLRDPAAWYHIVCSIDTTNTTSTDRLKLYVNGERLTDIQQYTTITQDSDIPGWSGSGDTLKIGNRILDGDAYFKGLLTHFHVIDGTIYTPTDFAETDSVSGIWKPKTAPSLSYGTNGGFYKFENSGAMGTDSSGQSNNCSVSGTLTQNVDSPSNNFATMNPLDNYWQGSTLSNGNTTVLTGSSSTTYNTSSIMVNTGKFYAECKVVTGSATANIGVAGEMADATVGVLKAKEFGYAYIDDGQFGNNGSASSYGASYANGDIIGIALDCTNNKLYFSKNGVFQDSGNPSAGSGGKTITAPASTPIGNYAFACNDTWNDNTRTFSWNFGNGFFGTTAVSSAGTAASTPGIFEYDVPTGYQPLSTKGLNA